MKHSRQKQNQLSLDYVKQALDSLELALAQPKNEFIRDAVIQRFEYSFELSWKTLKRFLKLYYAYQEGHLKDLFRLAAKYKLITHTQNWFTYLEARNLCSHTYSETQAENTYKIAQDFLKEAQELIQTIESNLE